MKGYKRLKLLIFLALFGLVGVTVVTGTAAAENRQKAPLQVEFRNSISTVEYQSRFVRRDLFARESGMICYEIGMLDQAQKDFVRRFWNYSSKIQNLEKLEPTVSALTAYSESAAHFCYGNKALIDPTNADRVPKDDRQALLKVLKTIEKLSEQIKFGIDQLDAELSAALANFRN